MVTAQGPAECRAATGGEAASEAACKPSSVPRKRGDGHPSRAPVTRRLLRPTRERGDAPLVRLTPHGLSYLALHQVELARFTRRRPEPPPTRLCGAGPRLSADGSYPLPCVAVLGLSSSGESPRRAQPSGHLAGEMTLAPAPRATRKRRTRPSGPALGCRRQRWATRCGSAPLPRPSVCPTQKAKRPPRGQRCLPWCAQTGSPPAERLLAGAVYVRLGRSEVEGTCGAARRSDGPPRGTDGQRRRHSRHGSAAARRVRGRGPDQAR